MNSNHLTEGYTTARDVLSVAHERLAPRVQRALEGVAASSEAARAAGGGREGRESRGGGEGGGGSSSQTMNPALRGVSQKLLEKVV